jgi:hypothetical protein
MPLKLFPVLPSYASDIDAQAVWQELNTTLGDRQGYAFYCHPNLGAGRGVVPDFAVLVEGFGAFAVKVVRDEIDDIEPIDDEFWDRKGVVKTRPSLELADLRVSMRHRFEQDRHLRGRLSVREILACPRITKSAYERKFGRFPPNLLGMWRDSNSNSKIKPTNEKLSPEEWRLAQSVFQSVAPLNRFASLRRVMRTERLGEAIRSLESEIALLDDQQARVAYQIPPGPQRVRGLAGTGKTVLLAMKAANIHSHYPDAKVLFTFNTQSLYNQVRSLISRFYRVNKDSDPDWANLQIRHAWGSSRKNGVYSDLCAREGETPLSFGIARALDPQIPFRACCNHALKTKTTPEYDYVLMDEAQDFPKEYFRLLYNITVPNPDDGQKRIYFAFDELQSLSSIDIPTAIDLFGVDKNGVPLVDLSGEYPGPMDKDLVLYKSYRCPNDVLMLAHGLGLGIHSKRSCVQMISKEDTWQSIGYLVDEGPLVTGRHVVISRPHENSPNRVAEIYKGSRGVIEVANFRDRAQEIKGRCGTDRQRRSRRKGSARADCRDLARVDTGKEVHARDSAVPTRTERGICDSRTGRRVGRVCRRGTRNAFNGVSSQGKRSADHLHHCI